MDLRGDCNPVCKLFLHCVKSVYTPEPFDDHLFFLDLSGKLPILSAMNIKYRKCIVWFMLSLYLMLAPIPLWDNEEMVLCLEDACAHCHDSIASLQDHCKQEDGACRKSCGDEPQISDSDPAECYCCVEIPISTYIQENTPLSRPHDPSGGIRNAVAPSLPGSHPLLNKASFPSSPTPHLFSTQKALRSVILII